MNAWGTPPRWFTWFCAAVVVVGLGVTVVGAVRIGITVDETFHVVRLQNYLDQGWYLLDDDLGPSGPGSWVADAFVYAPVTTLLLHVPNVLVGNESWGQVSTGSDAYVVRHLGVAALGACTVAASAAISRVLSGSWRWAVVTAAVLVCLPMWTGHAMFNVKDVPVGAGYTFVTLACMLVVTASRADLRTRVLTGALLFFGILLAVGTRPAIWPGLAAAMGCIAILVVVRRKGSEPREWWRVRDVAGVLAVALVVLAAIYPAVFTHPVQWLFGAPTESASSLGKQFRGYIPLTVASTVPLLLLIVGIVGSIGRLRGRLARRPRAWDVQDLLMVLVLLQALLLPGLLVLRSAALHGGLRHVMFAAPAAAVLITAGVAHVLGDLKGQRAHAAVAAMVSVGLAVPMAVQFQLFPYGYSYVNPLTDAADLGLPADFWQASFREYADDLAPGDFVVCGTKLDDADRPLRQMPNGGQSWLDLSRDCAHDSPPSVLQPYVVTSPPSDEVAGDFVALFVYDDPTPKGCTEISRVTRRRLVTEVVVSRALRCPLVLPAYEGPTDVDGAGAGAVHLLGGWSGDGGDGWITAEERASLGFELEGPLENLEVEIVGNTQGAPEFYLNNQLVAARETADGWVLSSQGLLPVLGQPGNVVVTVAAKNGAVRVTRFVVTGGVG